VSFSADSANAPASSAKTAQSNAGSAIDSHAVRDYLSGLQQHIVATLEGIDGARFIVDHWRKPSSDSLRGQGCTCILEGGRVLERAGVGFSHVHGDRLPPSASVARPDLTGCGFEALGLSLVLHPLNPYCPTVHMNVRLFCATHVAHAAEGAPLFWFGGGMDMTPYYGFEEDARHFHRVCHTALMPFGAHLYPRYKKQCDDYFYLKHRGEARGIGGIFFDDFSELGFAHGFKMMQSVGNAFLPAYLPILEQRMTMEYGDAQRAFQAYRRARYVEFNLIFDRGTSFGLQSGGRTESILLSMPPSAHWRYNWQPEPGTPEARLYSDFLVARDWL
jgi:coproporphyrinogen III oxidase